MRLPSITFYAALVALFSLETEASVFDLSNLKWSIINQNGTINIPASGPPSQAHLDLLKAGIVTDPLLEINGKYARDLSLLIISLLFCI